MGTLIYEGCVIENENNLLYHLEKFDNELLDEGALDSFLHCFNKSIAITFKANARYDISNGDFRIILEKVMFSALNTYFELIDEPYEDE